MPSRSRNKVIPPDKAKELERLRYEVKRKDGKGLHNTIHHELLAKLESELGLIPAGKIEGKKDEVTDGKSDI